MLATVAVKRMRLATSTILHCLGNFSLVMMNFSMPRREFYLSSYCTHFCHQHSSLICVQSFLIFSHFSSLRHCTRESNTLKLYRDCVFLFAGCVVPEEQTLQILAALSPHHLRPTLCLPLNTQAAPRRRRKRG